MKPAARTLGSRDDFGRLSPLWTFLLAAESRLRSDGSLWSALAKPAPGKPIRPAPASATPEGSGW